MGDIAGGLWAAISVLSGLQHRNSTGQGINIDLSLLEGLMGLLGYLGEIYLMTGEVPGRMGSQHHSVVPYGRYPVKDGHIVLAIHVGSFWRKFCAAIGQPELSEDERFRTTADRQTNRTELERIVCDILVTRTREEWSALFDEADVPSAPVFDMREAMEQPVIQARGFVTEVDHPTIGPTRLAASPLIFPGSFKRGGYSPAPLLGQHTREVLSTLADLDDAEINHLLDRHVLDEPAERKDKPAHARRKTLL
jgi:crotonobetainyl-CoA:carnitine CoA-transferase CaiB-like acyl-CoA transferase